MKMLEISFIEKCLKHQFIFGSLKTEHVVLRQTCAVTPMSTTIHLPKLPVERFIIDLHVTVFPVTESMRKLPVFGISIDFPMSSAVKPKIKSQIQSVV